MAKKKVDPENKLILNPANLEVVPLASLVPDPKNPRRGMIEDIKGSFVRFGQDQPLVVRREGRVIVKGNHRWRAASELGWTEIAVYWVDDDEVEAVMRGLADNRIADKAYFDQEELNLLLQSLQQQTAEMGIDFEVPGFDAEYLEDLGAQFEAPPTLDELEEEHGGEPKDEEFWPVIRFKVPPDVNDQWRKVVQECDGQEVEALTYLLGLRVGQ